MPSTLKLALTLALLAAGPAMARDRSDPRGLLPPRDGGRGVLGITCAEAMPVGALTLPSLVDLALCRNPTTAAAYAAARTAAAQVGQQASTLLPSLSGTFGPTYQRTQPFGSGSAVALPNGQIFASETITNLGGTAGLALNYLLFDFGGRRARIDAAEANQRAALATFADTAQQIVLQVVQTFNTLQANRALVESATANVRFAETSLANAEARERAGVGIRSDTLQARTALAQARLQLLQAQGQVATNQGQLAVVAGLPPNAPLVVAPSPPLGSVAELRDGIDTLIAQAERLRPDLRARREGLAGAEANVRGARSDLRPSVGVSVQQNVGVFDNGRNSLSSGVGVTVSVPLFDGFGRRYAVAAAESDVDRNRALVEQQRQQVGLDVWTAYQQLATQLGSLATAREGVASAEAAAELAQGRFKAGVGTITDLLNAQQALATARQQLVGADFGVRTNQAQLARAVGDVGEAVRGGPSGGVR